MEKKIIKNLISQKDYIFKSSLFDITSKFNLSLEEVFLLIYFMNDNYFDICNISEETKLPHKDILNAVASLTSKKIIELKVEKVDDKTREIVDLSLLNDEIINSIIKDNKKEASEDIFELFESEFGRTLSPIEYEIINAWIRSGMKEELIVGALKEATYNGVKSLRYIDKIIFEWDKKGFKSLEDVDKHLVCKEKKKVELFDYNWLDNE